MDLLKFGLEIRIESGVDEHAVHLARELEVGIEVQVFIFFRCDPESQSSETAHATLGRPRFSPSDRLLGRVRIRRHHHLLPRRLPMSSHDHDLFHTLLECLTTDLLPVGSGSRAFAEHRRRAMREEEAGEWAGVVLHGGVAKIECYCVSTGRKLNGDYVDDVSVDDDHSTVGYRSSSGNLVSTASPEQPSDRSKSKRRAYFGCPVVQPPLPLPPGVRWGPPCPTGALRDGLLPPAMISCKLAKEISSSACSPSAKIVPHRLAAMSQQRTLTTVAEGGIPPAAQEVLHLVGEQSASTTASTSATRDARISCVPLQESLGLPLEPPVVNDPPEWPSDVRGMPHYRALDRHVDTSTRPMGQNGIERTFLFFMFNGVRVTGVSQLRDAVRYGR